MFCEREGKASKLINFVFRFIEIIALLLVLLLLLFTMMDTEFRKSGENWKTTSPVIQQKCYKLVMKTK